MSTTLKLPQDLRRRVATFAGDFGQSPHAFMIAAIRQQTEMAELRRSFVKRALTARRDIASTGQTYYWDEVRAHYRAKLRGRKTARPRLRK